MSRTGLFWDVMQGRVPPPPAAETLGWELVAVDPEAGIIEVVFAAGEADRAGADCQAGQGDLLPRR